MTTTADTIRQSMTALTEAQSSQTLLESWITLQRQFATTTGDDAGRAATAQALDTIQHVLEERGMDRDMFGTLAWLIDMEAEGAEG